MGMKETDNVIAKLVNFASWSNMPSEVLPPQLFY